MRLKKSLWKKNKQSKESTIKIDLPRRQVIFFWSVSGVPQESQPQYGEEDQAGYIEGFHFLRQDVDEEINGSQQQNDSDDHFFLVFHG